MTLFSAITGACIGVTLQFYSNGVRKLPMMRQPWLHLAFGGVGMYMGAKYPAFEQRQLDEVNQIRKTQNLPPMRGKIVGN